jgi:hypothetical protein
VLPSWLHGPCRSSSRWARAAFLSFPSATDHQGSARCHLQSSMLGSRVQSLLEQEGASKQVPTIDEVRALEEVNDITGPNVVKTEIQLWNTRTSNTNSVLLEGSTAFCVHDDSIKVSVTSCSLGPVRHLCSLETECGHPSVSVTDQTLHVF